MENDKIRIVLVDDHPVVLQGLKATLGDKAGFSIVGAFTSGEELLPFLSTNAVDVVLLDIMLPDRSGVELCLDIKQHTPEMVVLILSNHAERSFVMQAVQHGANGYLLKNASLAELVSCIRDAVNGQIAFSDEVKKIIVKVNGSEARSIPQLTKREKEILQLLAEGKTSAALAEELHLSPLTIITHRRNLMQKFDVKNVAELIMAASRQNFL